jgi:RNA polymerase sigma-70 factor (ECF subfamily)
MSVSAARYFPALLGKSDEPSGAGFTDGRVENDRNREQPTVDVPVTTPITSTNAAHVATSISENTDESLMARICEGDQEALASLFRRYGRMVRGLAYRVLRDAAEADDLLQDIFILIHRSCKTFDSSKGAVRSWILQITYRRAISRRRYLTSRHFYSRLDLEDAPEPACDLEGQGGIQNDAIDRLIGQDALQKIFADLSEAQQKTLRLFFYDGYTFDEIATKLGQTAGNVSHHYYRGLEKLRKHIFGGISGPASTMTKGFVQTRSGCVVSKRTP